MLLELGLVPANCVNVELIIPANGLMTLRYDVYVTTEQIEQMSIVFQGLASESKAKQDG